MSMGVVNAMVVNKPTSLGLMGGLVLVFVKPQGMENGGGVKNRERAAIKPPETPQAEGVGD